MKGLDTPVLIELLRGSPKARRLARSLAGEEVATTEINLFELGILAGEERAPGMERRLAAVERLRRKLSVLPVDSPTVATALEQLRHGRGRPRAPTNRLIAACLASHGVKEWITAPGIFRPGELAGVKVVEYS